MWLRSALTAVVLVAGLALPAWADEGYGEGTDDSLVVETDSGFSSWGELTASIDAAAEEDVVGGSGGTFAFPINITFYGRQHLRVPADPTDWDSYCFIVTYATSHVDEVEDKMQTAAGGYELQEDRTYHEPATRDYRERYEAWEDAVDWVEEENERREADGEPLLEAPPEPVEPQYPLEACEGTPTELPDFTPAFDAAAELVRTIEPASPFIEPGRGIAGLEAYLQTRRPLDVVQEEQWFPDLGDDLSADPHDPDPIPGTVAFTGEGTWTVDWGDGTVDGPFTDPGVPYGDTSGPAVTHAYVDTGDYLITVTDSWRVSMTVTFLGDTFIFTHEETLDPAEWQFPVGEVRSVRDR